MLIVIPWHSESPRNLLRELILTPTTVCNHSPDSQALARCTLAGTCFRYLFHVALQFVSTVVFSLGVGGPNVIPIAWSCPKALLHIQNKWSTLQVDKGTNLTTWHLQWWSYCNLSGLVGQEASKKVETLSLCLLWETLSIVQLSLQPSMYVLPQSWPLCQSIPQQGNAPTHQHDAIVITTPATT